MSPTPVSRMILASLMLLAGCVSPSAQTVSGTRTTSATSTANAPRGAPATVWVYPLIKGHGGVHPRPDLLADLPAGQEYKVIADVVHGSTDHAEAAGALERLARLQNLFAYGGVPREHVHIAAVIEGQAGWAVLKNEAYRKRFKVDNPNLELLGELRRSGVELMTCAQALAENDISDGDVSPDVRVTLSALADFVAYEAQGYGYLQL